MNSPPAELQNRVYRSPVMVKVLAFLAAVAFLAGAVLLHRLQGWSWVTFAFAGMTVIGIAGLVDAWTMRVELHPEHIVVMRNLRKSSYPRSAFSGVTWGKGVPVSLQQASGGWVQLPGVGPSAQALVNTLRAWLKT
jgi:hypothetical protein